MIELEINNLKSIKSLCIKIPFEKGIYAITGENGVGKSTVFSALARLVYRGAFHSLLRYDGDDKTIVKFSYNGIINTWIRKLNWQRYDSDLEIFINGTFEASLIFGSRFADAHKSKVWRGNSLTDVDVIDADPFVKDNLGKILRNDNNYYHDLKIIKSKALATRYGFDGQPYFLKKKGKWLPQFVMSSGELLLVGLLHFINDRKNYKERNRIHEKSLILIDEIELALHPSAQERLVEFLSTVSIAHEFCIYFATHSLQIINCISPSRIFHIQRNLLGALEVINPCYPAYATRSLYTNDGFDFLFLVEDKLAKHIIDKIIDEMALYNSKLIKVLPCGGWRQTLEMHYQFSESCIAGKTCQIFSVLDGDVQVDYEKSYKKGTKYYSLPKSFLPIQSIEKHLKSKLISTPDPKFIRQLGDKFYAYQSLDKIIQEYSGEPKAQDDKSGKRLYYLLCTKAQEQGHQLEVFEALLCEFIYIYSKENFSALKLALEKRTRIDL